MSLLLRSPAGRVKPPRRAVSFGRTAPEHQWAWRGLVSYWPLWAMQGSTVHGIGGSRRPMSLEGSLAWTVGPEGPGVGPFSSSSYLAVTEHPDTDQNFTLLVYTTIPSSASGDVQFLFDNSRGIDGGFQMFYNGSGAIRFRADDSGSNAAEVNGPDAILGEPVACVLRADVDGIVEVAVDGAFGGSSIDISAWGDTSATDSSTRFGRQDSGSVAGNPLQGEMWAAAFWRRLLTDEQVRLLSRDPFGPLR